MKLNNHKIHSELCFPSNHAPLTVNIIIKKEFIPKKKHTIIKKSEEESKFVEDFIRKLRSFNIVNITDKLSLKSIV